MLKAANDRSEFALELQGFRVRHFTTVDEFAKYCQVSRESVHKWESNSVEKASHLPDEMWLVKILVAAYKLGDTNFVRYLAPRSLGKRGRKTGEPEERRRVAAMVLQGFVTRPEMPGERSWPWTDQVALSVNLADQLIQLLDQTEVAA